MSFPRYPSYKDSGVEWLGHVPAHWGVCALNYRYEVELGKMLDEKRITGNHLAPYLRNTDVQWNRINVEDLPQMDFANGDLERYSLERGDLLVCEGGEVGRAAIWEAPLTECYYQKALHRIRARDASRDSAKFLSSIFAAVASLGVFSASGGKSTIAHLPAETLRRYRFPFPPPDEQVAIAEFLDRETGKIDELVAEQRRLMELLKEKCQAVISHAVTRGLNPAAPLKPSGIEWLGDVPAHWEVVRIKRVASIRYGIGEPPKYHTDGTPLIRATNVHAGNLFAEGMVFVDPTEIPEQRIVWLAAGDIIVVRSGAYTGDSAIIPDGFGPCIAGFDMVLKCHSARPEFVQFALLSKYLKEGQLDLEKMRAAQPHLNAEELGSCILALPDAEEQDQITKFLKSKSAEFDTLTAEAQRAIDLLQERRTALISAAVTGQIDVRPLVAKEAA